MVACRLGRCAVPKVCPLHHCVCECILALSPPHHHVGGLKQAGNVGAAVWWAMNSYGDVAFADPVFAGRLPSLCTPSASCSYGPVLQRGSSGLHSPWDGSSLFLSSLSALLQFRGKTEVPTLDLRGSGMSRCLCQCRLTYQSTSKLLDHRQLPY